MGSACNEATLTGASYILQQWMALNACTIDQFHSTVVLYSDNNIANTLGSKLPAKSLWNIIGCRHTNTVI